VHAEQLSMKGRTCLITGATSGIGKATAAALARMGAHVFLVCRDPTRATTAVAEIQSESRDAEVTLLQADLASQASIRDVAREFLSRNQPLHVLVNNAGVVITQRTVTVDGIETVFAVNHLAYFLLTNLLLERLRSSAPARVINVASDAHKFGRIDFDDLGSEHRYRPMRVYGQSKLANIMFTYELARRLAGSGVTVNCLHPGAVATGLGKNNGAWARGIIALLRPFFRTPESGAATSIYLAASPEIEGVSGQYFVDCKPRKSSPETYDVTATQRLWATCSQLTGLTA